MPNDSKYDEYFPMANKFINPDGSIQTLAEIIGGGPMGGVSEAKPFVANYDYVQYEIIQNSGVLYAALANFTSGASFVAADWRELSGGSGSSVSKAQPFGANYAYAQYEIIQESGKTYAAKVDFTSTTAFNATDWDLIGGGGSQDLDSVLKEGNESEESIKLTDVGSVYSIESTINNSGNTYVIDNNLSYKGLFSEWRTTYGDGSTSTSFAGVGTEGANSVLTLESNGTSDGTTPTFSERFNIELQETGVNIDGSNNVRDAFNNFLGTDTKENTLTAGTNISIDRTTPANPILNVPNLDLTTPTTGAVSPTQYNALALKNGDFVTEVTASNKGVTEAELNALGNGLKIIGSYWFGLTGIVTPFTVPLPTDPAQSYFDFTTLTP